MITESRAKKTTLARELGVSRSSLYYRPKLPDKDWGLKTKIEEVLRVHPSYGHKRLALNLKVNKKRILRIMKKFGIKPYRRNDRTWKKKGEISGIYPNLLIVYHPEYEHISGLPTSPIFDSKASGCMSPP